MNDLAQFKQQSDVIIANRMTDDLRDVAAKVYPGICLAGMREKSALAETLTAEFGRGFDASNLRYMRLFYQAFPICDALRHELSWTHYRALLRVESEAGRLWYMNEAAGQNWSTRALDRQIGTLY